MMKLRVLEEYLVKALMVLACLIVAGSLVGVVAVMLVKGLPVLRLKMLVQVSQGGSSLGQEGGILNAILGSLYLGLGATALALVFSLPVALYLNLYARKSSRTASLTRFALDVLWGIPSIVYGAFGFLVMMLIGLRASLLAGIITVALLELPIMTRTMDEVVRLVPRELREASFSLGATRLETAFKVVTRQCLPGFLTAVLIAFGRGIGDAASVLFTAGFTDRLPLGLLQPAATLPLAIFFQLGTPFPEVQQRAYASAAVLTILILVLSILARVLVKRATRHVIK